MQPFKPCPLRFLRGAKTAPAPAVPGDTTSSLGVSSSSSSERPPGSISGSGDAQAHLHAMQRPGWAVCPALVAPPHFLGHESAERPVGGTPAQSDHGLPDLEAGLGSPPTAATLTAQHMSPPGRSSKASLNHSMPSTVVVRKGECAAV